MTVLGMSVVVKTTDHDTGGPPNELHIQAGHVVAVDPTSEWRVKPLCLQ